ncbi:hypothetical protein ACOMHN_036762 [Nucella lapillus]
MTEIKGTKDSRSRQEIDKRQRHKGGGLQWNGQGTKEADFYGSDKKQRDKGGGLQWNRQETKRQRRRTSMERTRNKGIKEADFNGMDKRKEADFNRTDKKQSDKGSGLQWNGQGTKEADFY